VSSKEEASSGRQKCPLGQGVKLEVRRVSESEEFPMDNPWIEKGRVQVARRPRAEDRRPGREGAGR